MTEEKKTPCVHLRRAGLKAGICPICHGARRIETEPLYPFKPIGNLPPNTLTNSDGTPYSAGHDEPVIEQIKKRAQNALESGGTWAVEYRLHSVMEALEDIVKLCDKEIQSQ